MAVDRSTTKLQFSSISKSFSGVQAISDVSFQVESRTVRALIGENGAGKSTILKILGGIYSPDQGKLLINGQPQIFANASLAMQAGIAIIHQELQYVAQLSVSENLLLGALPNRAGFVNWKKAHAKTAEILSEVGLDLQPETLMMDLSIGLRQMVEIAKAISRKAKILAFDEPTSSLSSREVQILFSLMNKLRAQGVAIIYVSHRLEEIFQICDSCTILRDGKVVCEFSDVKSVSRDTIISNMVGRKIGDIYNWRPRSKGKPVLSVSNLLGKGLKQPISFELFRGEILGVFGLVGAGRTELCRLLAGAEKVTGGEIRLDGKVCHYHLPQEAIRQGIALCPEDRKNEGIIAEASVSENINLSARRKHLFWHMFIDHQQENKTTDQFIASMNIKAQSREQSVSNLSGGNQQKTVIARWLAEKDLKVFLMDEPTRGIDVGAKQEIYQVMYDLTERGYAMLMVSSDLLEVIGVADRVLVMRDGAFSGIVDRAQLNEKVLLNLALHADGKN